MKNLILFSVMACTFHGFSQTFGEIGDEWHNSYTHHVGPTGPGQGATHFMSSTMFKYVGNTSVSSDTFQIIVKCQKRWGVGFSGYAPVYENDSIYVYQDSSQVFYGSPGDMKLIYDFNLEVGDSMMVYIDGWPMDSLYSHVIQTDSVEVAGTWRKRIIFDEISSNHEGMRWIEGVGDELYGLFRDPIGDYFDLHYSFCMKHDNVIVIGGGSVQYICADDWMSAESIEDNSLMVYPNPASDYITVSYPGISSKCIVFIYDSRGNLLIEKSLVSHQNTIDLGELSNGIYIIRVSDSKGSHTSKIVKR